MSRCGAIDESQPFWTFGAAIAVVIIGTGVVAPFRLPLLLIPGSFLLACYGMGLLFERTTASWMLVPPSFGPMLRVLIRLGTGMSLLGCVTTVSAVVGLYRLSAVPVSLGFGWGMLHLIRSWPALNVFRPSLPSLVGGLALGAVWSIGWLWATIPPTFYDELAYHLPIPQYALRSDHLPAFPWLFFSFMPHLSDLLLGWGLAFAGDVGARAMHFTFWIAIWVAGWAFVETMTAPRSSPWIGCLMAGAFASSAMFFFLGTLPFAETSLTFAVLASAAVIAAPGGSALWPVVGLLWALAVSVKLSGWMWVVAGALAALFLRWPMRELTKAGAVTVLTTLPWWGRAWWLTGNPIYPMVYRWLGGRYWTDESQARLQGDLPSYADPFNALSLLKLPYDMVMAPERFGSASDCGALAVGMICVMLSFPLWRFALTLDVIRRRQCNAASLFIIFSGLCWIMTSTTTRFFAPALLVGLSLLVVMLTWLRRPALIVALVLLSVFGAVGASRFLSLHDQVFSSANVALDRESASQFASRTVDHYEAALYVKEHLPSNALLLFIGESRPFYFDRNAVSPYPFHEHLLTSWIEHTHSSEEVLDRIRREGFTHVVLNTTEFKRVRDHYHVLHFIGPDAHAQEKALKQLPKTMTTLFSKNNVYVLEVPVSQ